MKRPLTIIFIGTLLSASLTMASKVRAGEEEAVAPTSLLGYSLGMTYVEAEKVRNFRSFRNECG